MDNKMFLTLRLLLGLFLGGPDLGAVERVAHGEARRPAIDDPPKEFHAFDDQLTV